MGADGFTSPPKEGVLRILIALKNPPPSAEFESVNLGSNGKRTITITLPRTNSSKCYTRHKWEENIKTILK
jgi:hypothetical protein